MRIIYIFFVDYLLLNTISLKNSYTVLFNFTRCSKLSNFIHNSKMNWMWTTYSMFLSPTYTQRKIAYTMAGIKDSGHWLNKLAKCLTQFCARKMEKALSLPIAKFPIVHAQASWINIWGLKLLKSLESYVI